MEALDVTKCPILFPGYDTQQPKAELIRTPSSWSWNPRFQPRNPHAPCPMSPRIDSSTPTATDADTNRPNEQELYTTFALRQGSWTVPNPSGEAETGDHVCFWLTVDLKGNPVQTRKMVFNQRHLWLKAVFTIKKIKALFRSNHAAGCWVIHDTLKLQRCSSP